MSLIPGICSQCGATLSVDKKNDAMVCPYCNTPFVVEKAIKSFNNTYNIINNITAENVYMKDEKQDFVIVGGTLTKYLGENVNVTVPDGVIGIGYEHGDLRIENYAFMQSMIETVILPDSVLEIGQYAFYNCRRLRKITLSKNLTRIYSGAFCDTLLEEVIVTDKIDPNDIRNLPAKKYYLSIVGAEKYGRIILDQFYYSNRVGDIYIENQKLSYEDCKKMFPDSLWIRKQEEDRISREEVQRKNQRKKWRKNSLCQYCGGSFSKGFFTTKCTVCGRFKDY